MSYKSAPVQDTSKILTDDNLFQVAWDGNCWIVKAKDCADAVRIIREAKGVKIELTIWPMIFDENGILTVYNNQWWVDNA